MQVVGDISAHVVKSIVGTLRYRKWVAHLNALKIEILFEVVYPLWRQLNPNATMVSLRLEWIGKPYTGKTKAIVSANYTVPQGVPGDYEAEFVVSYSHSALEKVVVYYRPDEADEWSYRHIEFVPIT